MKKFYIYGLKAGINISIVSFFSNLLIANIVTFLVFGGWSFSDAFLTEIFTMYLVFLSLAFILWIIITTIRTFFILKNTNEKSMLIYLSNFLMSYIILFILQFIYTIILALFISFVRP